MRFFLMPLLMAILISDGETPPDKPKAKEKEKLSGTVQLAIRVPKDCKIIVNEKPITYEKFEVLMEYTIDAFTIEDMSYKGGQFTGLKLRSRE